MPSAPWSAQRKRQYGHIKDGLLERGTPEPLAESIAARVVKRVVAQRHAAGRRGGQRSHQGPGGRTLLQPRNEARQRGLKGRSAMNKAQLEAALTP